MDFALVTSAFIMFTCFQLEGYSDLWY